MLIIYTEIKFLILVKFNPIFIVIFPSISVWCQANRKSIITIEIWFNIIKPKK